MKKFAIAFAFAVAACSGAEEVEEPVVEETVAAEPAAVVAADGGTPYGTFETTDPDGAVATMVADADGTFVMTNAEGETMSGTWTQDSPELFCSTMEGETEPTCYNEMVDAEGVWSSTNVNDPEDTSIVVRKM